MKFRLLLLLITGATMAYSQSMYSYITDKRFKDPSDLVGYNFVPNYMEVPEVEETELNPGEYSFGITQSNLYVQGEEISGVYSLNNINPTSYGYKLLLMNARDPRIQGHLKVILNQYAQVDALVFKRSGKDKEIVFFNAEMPSEMAGVEEDYFTDRWETKLLHPDSLWGLKVRPFFRIHDRDKTQERLEAADSTIIEFTEKISIIDKSKKKKKKKGEEAELAENEEDDTEILSAKGTVEDQKKKIKIIKKYFVEIRSILNLENGEQEEKSWTYEVTDLKEREDSQTGPDGERYQIELSTKKGPLFLYLTSERTISSFEMEGFRYLMQGH